MLRAEARPEDSSERYHDLTSAQQAELLAWITSQHPHQITGWVATTLSMLHSFGQTSSWSPLHGQLKGAFVAAGYTPVDVDAVLWTFERKD